MKTRINGIVNSIIYLPYHMSILAIFMLLLIVITSFFFIGLMGLAFRKLGLPAYFIILLLFSSFIFSSVNIPLYKLKIKRVGLTDSFVEFFGIRYHIPMLKEIEDEMIVAINVGGALIPTLFSIYLILRLYFLLTGFIIAITIVSLMTYSVAKPIRGVGIVTPALIPPIIAAISAWIIAPAYSSFIAYVSGTLGTLIGADLLNLPKFKNLEARVASIGGAGTFDGIFLSGIFAVILS